MTTFDPKLPPDETLETLAMAATAEIQRWDNVGAWKEQAEKACKAAGWSDEFMQQNWNKMLILCIRTQENFEEFIALDGEIV